MTYVGAYKMIRGAARVLFVLQLRVGEKRNNLCIRKKTINIFGEPTTPFRNDYYVYQRNNDYL